MSKQMNNSFRRSLSKIKIPKKQIQFSLRGCKHIRTPSFSTKSNTNKEENNPISLSDIDEFLFENFTSLYQEEISKKNEPCRSIASHVFESPRLFDPPQLDKLGESARFFVPARSSSSHIMEEMVTSSSVVIEELEANIFSEDGKDDFIALLTFSPSPYDDFKKSMEEMVEARVEHGGEVDWEFMEKLLFCYLDLNNKISYRFILRAFVDLIVSLREDGNGNEESLRQLEGTNLM